MFFFYISIALMLTFTFAFTFTSLLSSLHLNRTRRRKNNFFFLYAHIFLILLFYFWLLFFSSNFIYAISIIVIRINQHFRLPLWTLKLCQYIECLWIKWSEYTQGKLAYAVNIMLSVWWVFIKITMTGGLLTLAEEFFKK